MKAATMQYERAGGAAGGSINGHESLPEAPGHQELGQSPGPPALHDQLEPNGRAPNSMNAASTPHGG
jgi:hypothetical protein